MSDMKKIICPLFLGALSSAVVTVALGTAYSCTLYRYLIGLDNHLTTALGETIKNALSGSGICYYSDREQSIQKALLEIKTADKNLALDLSVPEYPNYAIVGFVSNDKFYVLTASVTTSLLKKALDRGGYLYEDEKVIMIVKNKITGKRLILKPLQTNKLLDIVLDEFD